MATSRDHEDQGAWADHPSRSLYGHNSHGFLVQQGVNLPDSHEQFVLGDGELKISEAIDTRTPNTSIFTLRAEDHTMGNLLADHLHKNSHVIFSAYKVPHPLFAKFELRVQTDGVVSPKEALISTLKTLIRTIQTLKENFKREYDLRKMVQEGQNGV